MTDESSVSQSGASVGQGGGRTGPARAWIGPEPPNSGHGHIIGVLTASPLGLEVPAGARYRFFEDGEWPSLDKAERADGYLYWREEDGTSSLLPWHRVDRVDWLADEEGIEAYVNGVAG